MEVIHNAALEFGSPKKVIDIGAGDGMKNSVSKYLIDRGWSAILVEPGENFKNIPDRENVIKLEVAISIYDGWTTFLINDICPDHSRIPNDIYYSKKFNDTPTRKVMVKCITLRSLFEAYPDFKDVGVLSIDTEGFDESILEMLMRTSVRPDIILVEHQHSKERIERQKEILTPYVFIRNVGVNSLFFNENFKNIPNN